MLSGGPLPVASVRSAAAMTASLPPNNAVPALDADSRRWLAELAAGGERRERAVRRLHALLVRGARFELVRRRAAGDMASASLEDLAVQAADDALLAVLGKLGDYGGRSRFTTWAYKFAILEAAAAARRRAWQRREVVLDPERWSLLADHACTEGRAETAELLERIAEGMRTVLTAHQREVLIAVALDDVPIDVLAHRLDSTRNAIYKTVHDARLRLRAHLRAADLAAEGRP